MKLIIGLGNPEPRYDGTRHNVGFVVLDEVIRSREAMFRPSERFKADIAELAYGEEKVLFAKPSTYYNQVGESARSLVDFYKIDPSDVLVIHDELALPLGTIRTRRGGSDAGNNGVKSLIQHLGADTARLRVGVWTEQHHGADKVGVVLGKLTSQERAILQEELPTIDDIITQFTGGTFETTTYRQEMK